MGAVSQLRRTDRLIVGSFDAAAHVLQQRARVVVLGAATLMLPMMAANLLLSVLAFRSFDTFQNAFGDRGYIGAESGQVFVAIVLQSFTAHVVGAYAAAVLVPFQLGTEPTMRHGLGVVLRRLPLLFTTWAVTHWWAVLLALAIAFAPSATGPSLVFMWPLVALATTLGLLVGPVIAAEQLGMRAIPRAVRLVRTRFGASWGFVVVAGLISGSLFAFIAQLPSLVEATGLVTFGSYGYLVQGVTLEIALLVVLPLSALATAQLYLQLRVHAEGIDLWMAADAAFGRLA
jgi:type III secretory pathway component EscS